MRIADVTQRAWPCTGRGPDKNLTRRILGLSGFCRVRVRRPLHLGAVGTVWRGRRAISSHPWEAEGLRAAQDKKQEISETPVRETAPKPWF